MCSAKTWMLSLLGLTKRIFMRWFILDISHQSLTYGTLSNQSRMKIMKIQYS